MRAAAPRSAALATRSRGSGQQRRASLPSHRRRPRLQAQEPRPRHRPPRRVQRKWISTNSAWVTASSQPRRSRSPSKACQSFRAVSPTTRRSLHPEILGRGPGLDTTRSMRARPRSARPSSRPTSGFRSTSRAMTFTGTARARRRGRTATICFSASSSISAARRAAHCAPPGADTAGSPQF